MTRALQTIPQEPGEDTSAEIYLTGAYFLLPFGSVLLLGLVALRVPGAQILAVGWYIFFLSFGPALFAVWCLYTCGAYDADALSVRDRLSTLSLRAYDARVAQLESEILEPVSFVVDAATRRRRAARAAEASAI